MRNGNVTMMLDAASKGAWSELPQSRKDSVRALLEGAQSPSALAERIVAIEPGSEEALALEALGMGSLLRADVAMLSDAISQGHDSFKAIVLEEA